MEYRSRREEMNGLLNKFMASKNPQYCLGYFFTTIVEQAAVMNSFEYDKLVEHFTVKESE